MKMPWEIPTSAERREARRFGLEISPPRKPPVLRIVPGPNFSSPYFARLTRLCEAQNWRCCYCGVHMEIGRGGTWTDHTWRASTGIGATIEHVVPRVAGGTNHWLNLAAACRLCNNARSAMKAERYLRFVMWKGRERAARYANRLRSKIMSRLSPVRGSAASL